MYLKSDSQKRKRIADRAQLDVVGPGLERLTFHPVLTVLPYYY